jgi:hypothetical protein
MVPQITNFSQIGKSSIFLPRKAQSALVLKVTAPDRVKDRPPAGALQKRSTRKKKFKSEGPREA